MTAILRFYFSKYKFLKGGLKLFPAKQMRVKLPKSLHADTELTVNTGLKLSQALTHPLHHDLQLYQITVPGSYKGDLSSSGTDKNVSVRMGP